MGFSFLGAVSLGEGWGEHPVPRSSIFLKAGFESIIICLALCFQRCPGKQFIGLGHSCCGGFGSTCVSPKGVQHTVGLQSQRPLRLAGMIVTLTGDVAELSHLLAKELRCAAGQLLVSRCDRIVTSLVYCHILSLMHGSGPAGSGFRSQHGS